MNVAICFYGSIPGDTAAAGRIINICQGLEAMGTRCQIFALPGRDPQTASESALPLSPVAGKEDSSTTLLLRHFPKTITQAVRASHQDHRFNAVYAYCDIAWPWLDLARFCNREGIPFVGDYTEWHRFRFRLLRKFHYWDRVFFHRALWRQTSGVVAISSWFAARAAHDTKPAVIIPPPFNPNRFTHPSTTTIRTDPFIITYMGGLPYRDLPLTMLKAINEGLRRGMNLRLRIIGLRPKDHYGGPAREIEQLLAPLSPLGATTEFTGRVDDATLGRLLSNTDALILLRDNHTENQACFPTRLPEYLYNQRPVIVSKFGDLPLYLEDNEVMFVPPGEAPEPVLEALFTLYGNRELCHLIGKNGREAALREFHYKKLGEKLNQFFFSLRVRNTAL